MNFKNHTLMSKLYSVLAAIVVSASAFAQVPEKMSYQAVVRGSSNALVVSSAVGMQLSILQGSPTGTAMYIETQRPTANVNGLVALQIGLGTVVSGSFASINWSNGPYFIKTETDPTGGTNYTIIGSSELLSVPYALHAKYAENILHDTSSDYIHIDTILEFSTKISNGKHPFFDIASTNEVYNNATD
jgi:hypothetical protein